MTNALKKTPRNIKLIFSFFICLFLIGGFYNSSLNQAQAVGEISAPTAFKFTRDLKQGMLNTDVKELQKYLNNNGFFVAETGAGSLGQEINFFGPATKKAVIKFQKANKIKPALGYFGLLSRNVANKTVSKIIKTEPLIKQVNIEQPAKQVNKQENQAIKNDYYSIGGSITGITGPVILQNNGQDNFIIDIGQNSNFTFPNKIANGASYDITVQPKNSDQICYAHNNIGVVRGVNIENIQIGCGIKLTHNPFTYVPVGSGTASYTLNYTANANGTISGSTSQTVNSGSNGSAVIAVPNSGYSFSSWSDGVLIAERTDTAITANKSVSATFVISAPSALSYTSPNLFIVNQSIPTLSPTATGTVASYAVLPSLPAGLSLNTTTGQITGTSTTSTAQTTYTVTATNAGGSTTFGLVIMVDDTVVGANGKIWLDRNLGATQVATSSADSLAYGDLYQWGRTTDGHQIRTSGTQSGAVANVNPGTSTFIIAGDWSSSDTNGAIRQTNWGVGGSSNPCPTGFRIPTEAEFTTEYTSWGSGNATGAFASPLKFTTAGVRMNNTGSVANTGSTGYYWSNTLDNNLNRYFLFAGGVFMSSMDRAYGISVRCTANSYAVAYNDNGATSGTKPANQTKTHDAALVLATNSGSLDKTGYTFAGWNTSADGTGTDYAVGANYTNNISITLFAKWTSLAAGSSYQGGKIAYVFQAGDTGYVAGQTHGLIASTTDQSNGIAWITGGSTQGAVNGNTLTAIGTGQANTNFMIAQTGFTGGAAKICNDYTSDVYTDWYLPSKDELNKLYVSRALVGGYTTGLYWSSSENSGSAAWRHNFNDNTQNVSFKSITNYVRCVRSF